MCTISLCMIVKNEVDTLARCLESVSDLVDEIILVDTGSEDGTQALARQYTEHVFSFDWIDDFAAARNFSFAQATMDYCMWLDADDVLEEGDRAAFRALRGSLTPEVDVVMMRYHTAFDAAGNPSFSYFRERIVRNSSAYRWKGAVHEVITPFGNIIYSQAAVSHRKLHPGDPNRNLRIFEGLLAHGQTLEPREQFYYARELYYHQRYEEAIPVLENFLSVGWGWVENNIDACRVLADCYDALGRRREALRALLESFSFDLPRAETCCALGGRLLDRGEYRRAAWWYEQALACPRDDTAGGFISPDCYGYLPCIQLCVCYHHLGDRAAAMAWNERAGQYKPEDRAYHYNRAFFAQEADGNAPSDQVPPPV